MCTVVYIPSGNTLHFASLRDEDPNRPAAIFPELRQSEITNVLAPKDALAGGTWLGINNYNNIIVLLNGGFDKHESKGNYRQSRGMIVSELLKSELPIVDWELYDLFNIEPFTLIVWSEQMLFQLVWDGNKKHRIKLDITVPQLFSSSTLYHHNSQALRRNRFRNWISNHPVVTKLSLLNFFKTDYPSEEGFIINRNDKVKTLSYSYIELSNNQIAELDYYDLQNYSHQSKSIAMKSTATECAISI